MRPCNPTLAAALTNALTPYWLAECYTIRLVDGVTVYRITSFSRDVEFNLNVYSSYNLERSKWSVTNTMQVPSMVVTLISNNSAFDGGLDIKSRSIQGFFDGATFLLTNVYLDASVPFVPGALTFPTVLGDIEIFGGVVSTVQAKGTKVIITVKGANNKMDLNMPRRVYQVSCNNTFCDPNCTLLRASFTASFTVGAAPAPTRSFIPWAAAPGVPSLYNLGTVTMTSGAADGEAMTVQSADATGLTLVWPLYNTPAPGDTFDAFQGCDKTIATCTSRGNQNNGLWFPFVPAAETAF